MFRVLPKEEKYFDMFNRLAAQVCECAARQQMLFNDFDNRSQYVDQIKQIEHSCDVITYDIIKKLNQTFITPFDREDIHALATGLDDVVDSIDYTCRRILLYRVDDPTEHALKMSDVLIRITHKLQNAVNALASDGEKVLQECIAVHALEEEGDHYNHAAVERLFAEEKDPIVIIKLKEIYEKLERGIDKAEDVAKVLEAIVLKNA